jgi:hypothetical protein
MGTLFSLSKSATSIALDISEIALLLFGILLVVGLIGEYAKSERWKRYVRTFEMFVIVGVAGELLADGGIFLFSSHLQTIADLEISDLTKTAGDARNSANEAAGAAQRAKDESAKATASASNALALAKGARREADSFANDIKSANTQAAEAESHLADALRQVVQAEAELNRIRSPRSITNQSALIAALTPFKGSEYTLNVFQDDESIQFTKVIDGVLGQAGWIRKQPEAMQLGIPSIDVFGQGIRDAVPVCVETGIQVHMRSIESLDALRLRAVQDLPKTIQAAIALRAALAARVLPSDERNVGDHVSLDKTPAAEGPVLICIGKKP